MITYESIAKLMAEFPRPKTLWIGFSFFVPERRIYKLRDDDRETVLVVHPDFRADLQAAGIEWRPLSERPWSEPKEEPWR